MKTPRMVRPTCYDKPRQRVEKKRHYSAEKSLYSRGYGLPSGHVRLLELDCKEGGVPKTVPNTFELWCWRRLLTVPWTARRSNQSILREINPEYSLEGLMLKLKLCITVTWCEQLTHWQSPWCWGKLRAEEEHVRGWGGWMHHPCNAYEVWEMVRDREASCVAVLGVAKSQTQLGRQTANNMLLQWVVWRAATVAKLTVWESTRREALFLHRCLFTLVYFNTLVCLYRILLASTPCWSP